LPKTRWSSKKGPSLAFPDIHPVKYTNRTSFEAVNLADEYDTFKPTDVNRIIQTH